MSCEAVCFWCPAGQLKSSYLPAYSPNVDRTQVPGMGTLSKVQFCPDVRSAQKLVPGHMAPLGQLAQEIVDPPDPALVR